MNEHGDLTAETTPNAAASQTYIERRAGDAAAPALLLLHGLGGTGAVWAPLLDIADWPGDIVVPDLRGHGSAPWTDHYSFGAMAADVAPLMQRGQPTVIVGHSMGGAVALALATGWFGIEVSHVLTIGIKVKWSPEELAAIDRVAAKPAREFDSEEPALEWAAKLAGLYGVVELDSPALDRAAVQVGGSWRAALDPRAGLVGPPPLEELHAANPNTTIMHTLGDRDAMVDAATARSMGRPIHVFADAGHNAMVEQPGAVWDQLRRFAT